MFAKLSPAQKARVVGAAAQATWSASSATASTTRRRCSDADVGISVDTAVDIAKESADIILLEKNLMVLEEGVLEGRKVFGNIIKYIKMGASSNFGNMFSVLVASAVPAVPADAADPGADATICSTISRRSSIPTDNVDEEYLPRRANGTSAT